MTETSLVRVPTPYLLKAVMVSYLLAVLGNGLLGGRVSASEEPGLGRQAEMIDVIITSKSCMWYSSSRLCSQIKCYWVRKNALAEGS